VETAADTARALSLVGSFTAVGIAGVAGAIAGSALANGGPIMAAIHPYLLANITHLATVAVDLGFSSSTVTATTSAGVFGATSIGVTVTVIVAAIVILVLQGINVFEASAIPGKLDEKIAESATPPNLTSLAESDAGLHELFAAYLATTLAAESTLW
jgi:hypothetical protein